MSDGQTDCQLIKLSQKVESLGQIVTLLGLPSRISDYLQDVLLYFSSFKYVLPDIPITCHGKGSCQVAFERGKLFQVSFFLYSRVDFQFHIKNPD